MAALGIVERTVADLSLELEVPTSAIARGWAIGCDPEVIAAAAVKEEVLFTSHKALYLERLNKRV